MLLFVFIVYQNKITLFLQSHHLYLFIRKWHGNWKTIVSFKYNDAFLAPWKIFWARNQQDQEKAAETRKNGKTG